MCLSDKAPYGFFQVEAHDDDLNAVAFADQSSHILYSGGDDGMCKVCLLYRKKEIQSLSVAL